MFVFIARRAFTADLWRRGRNFDTIDRHAQDRVGDAIGLMFERIVNLTVDEFALEMSRQTQCTRSRLRLILRENCLSRRTA
jgi:hypothetical protein